MSFPFYYLKVWGMSFSDKIFMTKIQRPQIFVCQKYFIALRFTNKKFFLRAFICSIPKMEDLGGNVMGFFWAHAWFVQCPWDLGCRGPGFFGLFLGVQMGLRGAMQWVFWAHAWLVPSWGFYLSILWYGSNPRGRKGTYISEFYFKGIVLQNIFFN